jgi:UDP-N-acetyl-D-glucosamine dehydrogenase
MTSITELHHPETKVTKRARPKSTDYEARLRERIRTRQARVSIVGQGYVGLPLATEFARLGFTVSGLDCDEGRVAALNRGRSCTPDVPELLLATLLEATHYQATTDPEVLSHSDVIIICVPTPLRKSREPDISYVVAAAQDVAKRFRPGQLVILESTTYPGTTQELMLSLFEERGARVGVDLFLAFSPERIDPGNRHFKVTDIPKVVGGVTSQCTQMAALMYEQLGVRVMRVSNPTVAELAKLYENVFRNVNIALANEMAIICRHLGVSSREVIEAAATKPFGFMPFYPGPGVGGHCIGVDPSYLTWKMRLNGYETRFSHFADEINRSMPAYVVDLVSDALNERRLSVNGASILALGIAYKKGVGDTRESPALEILARLKARGAEVSYADPYVSRATWDGITLESVPAEDEAIAAADCVLILTDHPEFDYARIVATARLVVDTRGATWGIGGHPDNVVTL